MTLFYWQTHDSDSGTIEANSLDDARLRLYKSGIAATAIKPQYSKAGMRRTQSPGTSPGAKLPLQQCIRLITNLSTLLSSGIPLSQAIEISLTNRQPKPLETILNHLEPAINRGDTLQSALKSAPFQLPLMAIAIVGAGEASGRLPTCLKQLSTHLSAEQRLRNTMRQALRYPMITLIAMLAVLILMLNWVMPQFASSFAQFGAELPYLTRCMLTFSEFSQQYAVTTAAVVTASMSFFILLSKRSCRWLWFAARLKMLLPFCGQIHRDGIMMRISATMALVLEAGIPLPDALRLAAPTSLNICFEQSLLDLAKQVESGSSLTEAIRLNSHFPVMIAQLIHIGEESGQLEGMFARANQLYKQRHQSGVQTLTSLLEPALMTLLCAMAGLMMLAVYLPIFQLGSVI
ncbi:MAG: type II secretion system F family protein [Pseudohongiella nitratireducens]|nr:type II secretion system F family protein [Pseudohongiella nitratireducens]MDF1623040.1 type II secretion system F family protein [Pseudohongiella nitratireducens]